jgi:hypothetical protein
VYTHEHQLSSRAVPLPQAVGLQLWDSCRDGFSSIESKVARGVGRQGDITRGVARQGDINMGVETLYHPIEIGE